MTAPIEVRFKGNRKEYFHWAGDPGALGVDDPVIVEAERGLDLGRVSALGSLAEAKCAVSCAGCAAGAPPPVSRAIVRPATSEETATAADNRRHEETVRHLVRDRTREHGLTMKIVDAEWQWDRARLTVFFTADSRVDFRSLVRDLATRLRTRIDLRQIGARDETARLGGLGRCGREFCCSTWLTDLSPVSLGLAKDQRLSLNPSQISGGCGRLLCCLKYEHAFYVTARKRFPKEGKTIRTALGTERVVAVDLFRERIFLQHEEQGSRIIPLVDLQAEQAGKTPPTPPEIRAASGESGMSPPQTSASSPAPTPSAPQDPQGTDKDAKRRRGRGRGRGRGRSRRKGEPDATAVSASGPPLSPPPTDSPSPAETEGTPARKRKRRRNRRGRGPGNTPSSTPES